MRVGLIDPAVRRAGHHVQFLEYVYALLRKSRFDVTVADFDNVVREQSDIPSGDIINLSDWVPTARFSGGTQGFGLRLKNGYRKWKSYSALRLNRIDVDAWVVTTYDPYVLPLLHFGGLDIRKTVPIVHYMKYFRTAGFRPHGITTYWTPLLLLNRLKRAGSALCLLHEHARQLKSMGFYGRCEYLSYNAAPESALSEDNRDRRSDTFRLCTLGIIRPDKDIGLVLRALRQCEGVEYFIAGELGAGVAESAYFRELQSLLHDAQSVTASTGFLPAAEYRRQIERAHFSVVPIGNKYGNGVQQTGLLVDSLINKRPVIGPDLFPVNQFVREYGVGLLYEPDSVDSLADTIREARFLGADAFSKNISGFLKENTFEHNAEVVKNVLSGAMGV